MMSVLSGWRDQGVWFGLGGGGGEIRCGGGGLSKEADPWINSMSPSPPNLQERQERENNRLQTVI